LVEPEALGHLAEGVAPDLLDAHPGEAAVARPLEDLEQRAPAAAAAEVRHRAAGRRLVRGLDRVGGRVGGDPAPLDAGGGGDDLERRAGEEVLAVRPGEERL